MLIFANSIIRHDDNLRKMTVTKNIEENSGVHMFSGDGVDSSKNICYGLRKINNTLVNAFYKFGYQVGLRPRIFIILPFIVSLVLGSGLIFIKYEEDPLKLFVPYTAPFRREQEIIESHFKMNYSHWYDPLRFTRHEGHSRVIVSAKDDKSIFRSILWPEIMDLSYKLLNVSVEDENGVKYYYEDICAKWDGKCLDNTVLNINEIVGEIENGTTSVLYPVMVVPFIVPQLLGGVKIDYNESKVEDALAVLLTYFLDAQSPDKKELSYKWEGEMLKFLHNVNYEHIRVSYFASRSIADELKIKMDACIPYIPMTGFIMITACMALLWMSDCIRSKPLIGLIGIISASIGVDDIFVAISAWQKTSTKDTVPNRLAQTYADAAVSVTITSLTNALARYNYFRLRLVRNFLWRIFSRGRIHGRTRKTLSLPSQSQECRRRLHGKNTQEKDDNHVHVVSAFFRDKVGSLLCNSFFRGCVLLSLIGYLSGAIYGLTVLREGLFRHRMALDSSYFVNVVISGNISYSDPETQEKLFELQKTFESLPHAGDSVYTQSWFSSFMRRLKRIKSWKDQVHDEKSFIKVLRENFLNKESHLSFDVEFNEDYSRILASRMIFQAANVKDVYDDVIMMDEYREAAKKSEFEHYMMKPLAIQSILIAIVVVVVVALLFIPDVRGSIAIACSILSIATGVLGYMSFWHINLDHVSSGSIFMCIGFSVDFSAHITYTYLSSKADTTEGKIRENE
ncbi:Patched domain-containing protein 3 [Armadillidium nasatum]|uniref:Patched domain-containing protein 3 n=1 Tax=Armadillidium nasatum TaxID=96803 RepID=A0A5N5TM90_9CRUS|nr:Patched domain-containing protein 3 [Armadillidium nasatum]